MKKMITLCVMTSSILAHAEIIRSPIHSIERYDKNSPYIVKFENGRVGFVGADDKALNETLNIASHKSGTVEAKLNKENSLVSLKTLEVKSLALSQPATETLPPSFEPTILNGLPEATKIFQRLNPNYRRSSECSNRAHVWAHEEFTKNGLKSQKAFVFFTNAYISRNKFKWWYHVAPMFQVRHNNKVEGYVMDFMFDHRPKTFDEWKDNFVFSKRKCKELVKFSDYDLRADMNEDCYQKIGTMYDWNPLDFKNQERGIYKNQWSMNEVRAAYNEAF